MVCRGGLLYNYVYLLLKKTFILLAHSTIMLTFARI